MLGDVLLGISVVVMLSILLTVAVKTRQDGSFRLAERRAAVRLAEQALLQLHSGEAPVHSQFDRPVRIRKVDRLSPVEGMTWTRVEVDYDDATVQLVGLASDAALAKTEVDPW